METAEAEFGAIPGFGEGEGEGPGAMQGNPPPDVPLLPDHKDTFASPDMVNYTSGVPFADAIDFYKKEMVANGWNALTDQFYEDDSTALMNFEKPERTAMVTITRENDVSNITIMIIPK